MTHEPVSLREKAARWAVAAAAVVQVGGAQPLPERSGLERNAVEIQASQNEAVSNLQDLNEAAKRMNERPGPTAPEQAAGAAPDPRRTELQKAKQAHEEGRSSGRAASPRSAEPERRRRR